MEQIDYKLPNGNSAKYYIHEKRKQCVVLFNASDVLVSNMFKLAPPDVVVDTDVFPLMVTSGLDGHHVLTTFSLLGD